MFVPYSDFRPHALIQHGTISIWKTHKASGTKNHPRSLVGQHGAASVGRSEVSSRPSIPSRGSHSRTEERGRARKERNRHDHPKNFGNQFVSVRSALYLAS